MKRRGNFLITENSTNDIIHIKHIVSIENYDEGSKIKMINGSTSYLENDLPEKILEIIVKKKARVDE